MTPQAIVNDGILVTVIFSRPGSGGGCRRAIAAVAYPSYLFRFIVAPSERDGEYGGMFFSCRDAANGCREGNLKGMVGWNPGSRPRGDDE